MGITDFFRPKYRHSDVKVRTEAVRALSNDDATILVQIARSDRDPSVRRIAIEKLEEAELLADIAKAEEDRALRDLAGERAAELWITIACDEDDEVGAGAALEGLVGLNDQRALAQVAARASFVEVRKRAAGSVREARALVELAKTSTDGAARLDAVARISDVDALRALAVDVNAKEIGIAAVDKLDDVAALEIVAQKAKAKQVRQRARKKLTDREEAEKKARPQVADDVKRRRAEKSQVLRTMEALAETFDWDKAEGQVAAAEREWTAIGDAGDVAADEKFAKLVKRYRDRRGLHDTKLEESRQASAAAQPRREEPRREEPRRDERRERERDRDDVDVIGPAAAAMAAQAADPVREARMKEAQARREEREARRVEDDAKRAQDASDREVRQKESFERGKQIAASLEALCADLEQMVEATDQRAVQRLLDQAGKAFEQLGKIAPEARAPLERRYAEARAKLVIKIKDLRETEDWARWANVPRQESLIKEAEALAAAEAPTLPQLQDVQKRWKNVGPVPQNKSKELWEKFKTAADAAFAKIRGARDVEKAQWDENVAAREKLVEAARALSDSSDWDATAEALKGLQAQWKSAGPVPRKQGDALWKQFRAACDTFFERRKPILDARQGELVDNLAAKEALCAKVEALVAAAPGEGGWGAAITAIKRAQLDWRDIGYVPRNDVDAIYARFRAACDGLFAKRDAARDAEAEAERAEVEALRGEIEAVTASTAEGGAARVIAVHAQLRALAERGLQPSVELGGLYERMVRHVLETDAAGLRGSELDPDAAQRKREKLLARAEELLPKDAPTIDAGAGAEDVAAKLRAALKSNALGGVRWDRDPRETIDELRAEWKASGPVIGDAAEASRAAFEAACAKVVAAAGGEREREARDDRGPRDRDDRGARNRDDRDDRGGRRRERRQRRAREGEDRIVSETSATPATAQPADGLAAIAAATGTLMGVPEAVEDAPAKATRAAQVAPVVASAPAPSAASPSAASPSTASTVPTAGWNEPTKPAIAPPPPESAASAIVTAGWNDVTTPVAVPALRPAAPKLPEPPPAATPVRTRSITAPPPADPVDDSWGEDLPAVAAGAAADAKPEPQAQPPNSGEMAGDGATDGDNIDAGWD